MNARAVQLSLRVGAVLCAIGSAAMAHAVTCTGAGLGVTLASNPLAFGSYTVLAQATANQVVTLTCRSTVANEGNITYRIRLTVGSTSGAGGLANRTMFNGTQALLYNIYREAAFTSFWGNTNATQFTGTLNFTGQPINTIRTAVHTGYGRIVANQDLDAGNYSTTTTLQAQARVPNAAGGTTYNSPTHNVTAVLSANCLIDSAGDIAFGAYDPTGASNVDATSSLITRCTNTTPYSIALSTGAGTYALRKMDSAGANADQLDYNLYTDATRTIVWGDGTGGSSAQSGAGAGILAAAAVTRTIYGRLFPGQDMSADTYSDTITVTVSY